MFMNVYINTCTYIYILHGTHKKIEKKKNKKNKKHKKAHVNLEKNQKTQRYRHTHKKR